MSDEDQIPDPLASMDQLLRGVADVAKVMRSYYTALEEQGFTPEQALLMTDRLPDPGSARDSRVTWLAQMEARRLVLSLREMLVRHDENEAAHTLMQHCVPYICQSDPEIHRARQDQAAMVEHLSSPEAYARYYRSNVHERPFEDQYGIEPGKAHELIPRVQILRDELERERADTLLDVGCNDGWLAANLFEGGIEIRYHGIDLNPGCVKRAKARLVPEATFAKGQLYENAAAALEDPYDVGVCFEVVEHVRDPDQLLALLAACVKPQGRLIISTPCGATEGGNLPQWWHVEPKGHVRVYTPESFHALLSRHGTPGQMVLGPDGVLVCPVRTPGGQAEGQFEASDSSTSSEAAKPEQAHAH